MIIEEYLIQNLSALLTDTPVYGDVPSPVPRQLVTIEKTGSEERNHIITATVAIQSWSDSRYNAAVLNQKVKQAMQKIAILKEIARIECISDYNYTDNVTQNSSRKNRYQTVFEVTYYERS